MSQRHNVKKEAVTPVSPPSPRLLSERIAAARPSAGLTQRELCRNLGVSSGAIGQWETGGSPTVQRLARLATVFEVSVDWLLGRAEQAGAAPLPTEDDRLLGEARALGIDLHAVVRDARQQRWIEENRGALSDANAFLERRGLWSDGKRQF